MPRYVRTEIENILIYLSDNLLKEADIKTRFKGTFEGKYPVILYLDYIPTPVEFASIEGMV